MRMLFSPRDRRWGSARDARRDDRECRGYSRETQPRDAGCSRGRWPSGFAIAQLVAAVFAVLVTVSPADAAHAQTDRPRVAVGQCGTEPGPANAGRDRHEQGRDETVGYVVAGLDDAAATDVNAEVVQDDWDPHQSAGGAIDVGGGKRRVDREPCRNGGFVNLRFAIQRK
jgi:hypothetical protein